MPGQNHASNHPTELPAPPPKPAEASGAVRAREEAVEQQAVREVLTLKRSLRKVWVLIAGTVVIIVGIIISPLPGPGFTILGPIGLAMIASEFAWARRLLKQVQARASVVKHHTDSLGKQSHPVIAVLVVICYWALVWWMVKEFEGLTAKVVLALSFPFFTPVALWAWAAFGLKTPWEKKKEREKAAGGHDAPAQQ